MKKFATIASTFAFATALAVAPASAGTFSLFGSWNETDALGDAIGGGLIVGIPLGDSAFDLDLRATYYEELQSNDFDTIIDGIFDDDDPDVLEQNGVEVLPVEIGVRYNFAEQNVANFYLGGGGGYYFLDSNRADIDDEFGVYGLIGATFGDPEGIGFFLELMYREVEGTVFSNSVDDIDDIDDIDTTSDVTLDIAGPAVNAGITWRF